MTLGREHRPAYFAHLEGLGVTPGQAEGAASPASALTSQGRKLTDFETRICCGCHATRVAEGPDEGLEPAALIANVPCERCHGPGGRHVEVARGPPADQALPFGTGRASPEEEIRLCGEWQGLSFTDHWIRMRHRVGSGG